MSKKKKHQKQVNTELQPGEQVRRPAKLSESTMTFDAMFSSALQQMLDVQEGEQSQKIDEPLTLELPKHSHSRHEHSHTETPKSVPEVHSSKKFVEGADFDIFASDEPEDGALFDMGAEEARVPYEAPEEARAEELLFTLSDQPKPQPERPSTEVLQQDILRVFPESPAAEELLTMPKENLLDELPLTEALPEHFTVPSAKTESETVSAPERFVVPDAKKESRQFDAPRYIFTDDSATAVDRETAPEVFRFPEVQDGADRPAAPEVFAVPDSPEDTERLAEPKVFAVPELTEEEDGSAELKLFGFARPAAKETTPPQPDTAPAASETPETAPKKEKRRLSLFGRKKTAEPEAAPEHEPAPEPETPAREVLDIRSMDLSQNDTATLLSVIHSLIGSDIQPVRDAAEKSPATVSPQPSAETQKPQTPQKREETAEEAVPIEEPAPETPRKLPDEPTLRFTPHREAVQPAPQEKPPAKPVNFWEELDELKALVGVPMPEDDADDTPPESSEEAPAEQPEPVEEPASAEDSSSIEKPAPAEEAPPAEVPAPSAGDAPTQKPGSFRRERRRADKHTRTLRPEQTEEPAAPLPEVLPQPPQEPVIIPSASVKTASQRQPVRERPARSEPRTAERPARRRPAPEKQTVLRPDEVTKNCTREIGTTGTRLLIVGVLELISLLLTLYASFGWDFLPQGAGSPVTAYILLGLLLICAVLAIDVFKDAVKKLQKPQFTAPLLVLLAVLAVSFDALQAAVSERVPFCAAAGLLVLFLLWDKYDGMTGILTTMRVLMGAKTPTGIVEVVDVMKGRVGLSRAEGSVEDFMDKFGQASPTEKLMQIYVPIATVLSLVASAIIAAKCGTAFLWTLSLLLLGCIPLIGLLNYSRLFCILAKRLSDSDTALCGWYGAEIFGGDHSILAGDNDLFPQKSIKLNGIKVLTKEADRVVSYAAATLKAAGSALYPMFEEELQSRNARRFRVERYRFYEGGIGSEISGDVILMGTMDFMKRMGVHMQGGMKLKQAVYTSVNGELAAVFAIKFTPKDSVRRGLAAVTENRHFRTIFVTRDFLLTPELISDKYEITLHNTAYPPVKERIRLSETELKEKGKQGALMSDDSFGAFADAAAGGRILKSAVRISMLLTVFNGVAGAVLMAVLAAKNGLDAATALNLLLYQLVWALPTLLLTGWTRRY